MLQMRTNKTIEFITETSTSSSLSGFIHPTIDNGERKQDRLCLGCTRTQTSQSAQIQSATRAAHSPNKVTQPVCCDKPGLIPLIRNSDLIPHMEDLAAGVTGRWQRAMKHSFTAVGDWEQSCWESWNHVTDERRAVSRILNVKWLWCHPVLGELRVL